MVWLLRVGLLLPFAVCMVVAKLADTDTWTFFGFGLLVGELIGLAWCLYAIRKTIKEH